MQNLDIGLPSHQRSVKDTIRPFLLEGPKTLEQLMTLFPRSKQLWIRRELVRLGHQNIIVKVGDSYKFTDAYKKGL